MISKLKSVELEYIRCFAQERNFESLIKFYDHRFKNTYTSNVTVLNKDIANSDLIVLINKEIKFYKKSKKDFLNFEINKKVSEEVINNLMIKPERIDKFNYFLIKSEKYKDIKNETEAVFKKVNNSEDFKNIIDINVRDSAKYLGRSYALQRIKRKIQAYKDESNNLNSYICYKGNNPIGSCELLIKGDICKLEDFMVQKEHRGKGFGTFMIQEILRENYERGVEYTYLISEENGEAEKLYIKLGFTKHGKKTQLIW